jgi:hypothetical protein
MDITITQLVPIAQVFSTLIGAGSVGVAAYGLLRNASVNRKQTNSQIFLDCVKRYEKIIETFPAAAWTTRFGETLPTEDPATTVAVQRYLNLCSEEYYLKKHGYFKGAFSKEIWEIWEELLRKTLRGALFRREWEKLKGEFLADTDFYKYVETIKKP